MVDFYIKCNTGLKWVNELLLSWYKRSNIKFSWLGSIAFPSDESVPKQQKQNPNNSITCTLWIVFKCKHIERNSERTGLTGK